MNNPSFPLSERVKGHAKPQTAMLAVFSSALILLLTALLDIPNYYFRMIMLTLVSAMLLAMCVIFMRYGFFEFEYRIEDGFLLISVNLSEIFHPVCSLKLSDVTLMHPAASEYVFKIKSKKSYNACATLYGRKNGFLIYWNEKGKTCRLAFEPSSSFVETLNDCLIIIKGDMKNAEN